MKNLSLSLTFVLALTFVPLQSVSAATTIFSDDFENPTGLGNWLNPNDGWVQGEGLNGTGKSAKLVGGEHSQSLTKSISTVGYQNITMSFWYKASSLDVQSHADKVKVSYVLDGVNQTEIVPAEIKHGNDDGEWHQIVFSDFPSDVNDNSTFAIKFSGDLNSANDTVWIDNFAITGEAIEPVCETCGGEGPKEVEPFYVKVHKYVDRVQPIESEASFPVRLSLGNSSFEGSLNNTNSFEYTLTNTQEHESLNVEERVGDSDEDLVLPFGAECSQSKYRLAGYSWGETLEEAQSKNEAQFTTSQNLNLGDVSSDTDVIIWNEKCPDNPPQTEPAPTPIDNGRSQESGHRQDISSLLSGGGEVLGASTEAPMCEEYLKDYIKLGGNNDPEEVKKLQIFLNQFFEVQNPVTGFYGITTFEMVKKFQAHQEAATLKPWQNAGLPTDGPTGYVYKTTKRWINILKCPQLIETSPIPSLP